MTTYLLTWNGSESTYPTYLEDVDTAGFGESIVMAWRVDGHPPMSADDDVYLLRQGREEGVIARGSLVDGRVIPQSRTTRGKSRGRTQVQWEWVLPPDEMLPIAALRLLVPQHNWDTVHTSGGQLSAEAAGTLDELWTNHLGEMGLTEPPDADDEFEDALYSTLMLQAIAEAAVDQTAEHLLDLRYAVEPPPEDAPYQLSATLDGQTTCVLAKGVLPDDSGVMLSGPEVLYARQHRGSVAMGLVTGITLDPETAEPTRGLVTFIRDWDPDDGELEPVLFRYSVRPT